MVSADIQTSSHELVQEAGGVAFVNKPFDRNDILTAIDAALARGVGMKQLTAVQTDALVELLNIAFGRAAAALSPS